MEEPEFSSTILSKLNLDDIEKVVNEAYHNEEGQGRPPLAHQKKEAGALRFMAVWLFASALPLPVQ